MRQSCQDSYPGIPEILQGTGCAVSGASAQRQEERQG